MAQLFPHRDDRLACGWLPARARTDEAAFARVNAVYGLQAGVFTRNLQTAFQAHRVLRVGGVIIGYVPSFRADQMPYGGVKGSGVGRVGLRSAMEEYTEPPGSSC